MFWTLIPFNTDANFELYLSILDTPNAQLLESTLMFDLHSSFKIESQKVDPFGKDSWQMFSITVDWIQYFLCVYLTFSLVGLHIATLKTVWGRQPSSGCNLRGLRPGIINSKISLVEGGSLYHQLRCQLQKLLKIVNQSNKKLIFYTDNLKS